MDGLPHGFQEEFIVSVKAPVGANQMFDLEKQSICLGVF